MKTKLLVYAWGHAILHAALLVHIRPTTNHKHSPIQLVCGQQLKIFHLCLFGLLYMFILHPYNALKWVFNVGLEFMLVLILYQLFDILNL